MKTYHLTCMLLIILMSIAACTRKTNNNSDDSNKSDSEVKIHSMPKDAVEQGKNDLIVAARQLDLSLGFDVERLNKAQSTTPLKHHTIDIEKLLKVNTFQNFSDLSIKTPNDQNYLVPLTDPKGIITTIDINQVKEGWKLTGMSNQGLSNELNELQAVMNNENTGKLSVFYVPNLNTRVYEVQQRNGGMAYYTNYKSDRFNRQGYTAKELLKVLKADATRFDKKYRDLLKKNQLLE